jgi:hypothetical protein
MIAMAGEANRKVFFNDRSLSLSQGYRILLGGVPTLEYIKPENASHDDSTELIKRLALLLRRERINEGTNNLCFHRQY